MLAESPLSLASIFPEEVPFPATSTRTPLESNSTFVAFPSPGATPVMDAVFPSESIPVMVASAGMMAVAFPSSAFPRAKLSFSFPVNVTLPISTDALASEVPLFSSSVPMEPSSSEMLTAYSDPSPSKDVLDESPLSTAFILPVELPLPATRVAFPLKSSICVLLSSAFMERSPPETVTPLSTFSSLSAPDVDPLEIRSALVLSFSSPLNVMANFVSALTAV